MNRVKIGRVEVVSVPSPRSQESDSADVRRQSTRIVQPRQFASVEAAQQIAGYKLWSPSYLPSTDLQFDTVSLHISEIDGSQRTQGSFMKYRNDNGQWLVLEQSPLPETPAGETLRVEVPFDLQAVAINSQQGALFTHAVPAPSRPEGQVQIVRCLWEQGPWLMELHCHGFQVNDLVRIAGSLR